MVFRYENFFLPWVEDISIPEIRHIRKSYIAHTVRTVNDVVGVVIILLVLGRKTILWGMITPLIACPSHKIKYVPIILFFGHVYVQKFKFSDNFGLKTESSSVCQMYRLYRANNHLSEDF